MSVLSIGIDPSLTACGWSDGEMHTIIATSSQDSLRERCRQIYVRLIRLTEERRLDDQRVIWCIEAPLLISHNDGAMTNLFDRGYLSSNMDDAAEAVDAEVLTVPIATLRKFLGKGMIPKAEVPLRVYKRWGVEFQGDRGVDKCFAFLLHKYGLAVDAGEIEHVPQAKRGAKRAKASAA